MIGVEMEGRANGHHNCKEHDHSKGHGGKENTCVLNEIITLSETRVRWGWEKSNSIIYL